MTEHQQNGLRSVKSLPGLGRLFLLTAGKKLAEKLMKEGSRNPRMFNLWMGTEAIVTVTHPDLARQVLTRPQDFQKFHPVNQPRRMYDVLEKDKNGNLSSLVMNNGEDWAALRKPVEGVFAKENLLAFVPKFSEASDKLIEQWMQSDGVIDAKQGLSYFALDVLGGTVFGHDFGAIDGTFDATYEHYQFLTAEMMNPLFLVFPKLEQLPTKRNRKFRISVEHMRSLLQGRIDARVEERKKLLAQGQKEIVPKDMLDHILGINLEITSPLLEKGQILPILWIFFVAGHDTTAISLSWLMHFLAVNPDVQSRAREEAIAALGGDENPDPNVIEGKLPYISAVLSENLRLMPPVYNLMTRSVARDTELDGVFLPKDTRISIHIAAVNRHAEAYQNPDKFDPERFLQNSGTTKCPFSPRIFNNLPFSAGPRRCLGDKFSLLEQKTLLVKLLSKLEILPLEERQTSPPEFGSDTIAIMFLHPKEMRVRVRRLQA